MCWCTLIRRNEKFQMGIRVKRGKGYRQGDFVIHINGLWRVRACLLDNMSSSWHREFSREVPGGMDRPQKVEKQRHLRECLTAVCLHREKKNAYYFLRRCGVYFVITITSYTTYPLYSLLSETTFPLTPARSIRVFIFTFIHSKFIFHVYLSSLHTCILLLL